MRLRAGPDAFRVTELPEYEPCGTGDHLFVEIEKRDLTTDEVARALARACGRPERDVGYAGRKDRHAVARQWFSVHLGEESRLERLALPTERLRVVRAERHTKKLRRGHLAGNRFALTLDGVEDTAALRAALDALSLSGLSNRFGFQRFGLAGANLAIARHWADRRFPEAVECAIDPEGGWAFGTPLGARRPRGFANRIASALRRRPDDAERALRAGGRVFRQLIASAAQSAVFNAILDAREAAGLAHTLRPGDLALAAWGGPFLVDAETLDDTNARARPGRLEVRASAPLPGEKVRLPSREVCAEERAWSADSGFAWEVFESGALASPGERRPAVVPFLEAPDLASHEATTAVLTVALPAGSFATELLAACEIALPDDRSGRV